MEENNKQQTDLIKERFISYYTRRFPSDLKSFYYIQSDFGDRTYPFVLGMTSGDNAKSKRRSMKWEDIEHFHRFSVSVFFTSMCSQVIGRLYGWLQMENFMRASGWQFEVKRGRQIKKITGRPMLNCGMGGLMHPIRVIAESGLYPKENKDRYVEVLQVATEYLKKDFLDFFTGQAENLNINAYRQLCAVVIPQEVVSEFQAQVSLYEAYIGNPEEVRFESTYVEYPSQRNRP